MPNFNDYMGIPTPKQLHEIYNSGFQGTLMDNAETRDLNSGLTTAYAANPRLRSVGKGLVSLPFKAILMLEPNFGRYESQTTGDCVSHSTRNAGMVDYCMDAVFGETTYKGRFATENIYGYRGHSGQGAHCSRLANYVSKNGPGGFLVRKRYESGRYSVDLTTYNSRIGHNWGRSGTPSWLNEIADDNKAMNVYKIDSVEEARDTIAAGFGLSVCSGHSFSSRRNSDGVADRTREGWGHAMAWIAVDDSDWAHATYGGMLFLVQNSWGRWNGGGKGKHGIPDGSFWIRQRHAEQMIDRGGYGSSYAITAVRGIDRVAFDYMGI